VCFGTCSNPTCWVWELPAITYGTHRVLFQLGVIIQSWLRRLHVSTNNFHVNVVVSYYQEKYTRRKSVFLEGISQRWTIYCQIVYSAVAILKLFPTDLGDFLFQCGLYRGHSSLVVLSRGSLIFYKVDFNFYSGLGERGHPFWLH